MILTNESPAIICSLSSLLVTKMPGARVVIITDSPRFMEPDYLIGADKFFGLFARLGVSFTVQKTSSRLKLKNGSCIDFVPLRCETDIDRIRGMQAEMWALDHRCLFTIRMLNVVKSRDYLAFTMDDLKRLQTVESDQVFHRR
jgi:hypothetical protein